MYKDPRESNNEAVNAYFSNADAAQLSNRDSDERVWGHDFVHTILRTSLASNRSEEITGIYQAVLLRNSSCTTVKKPWKDGGEIPSLQEIKTETIPKLRAFVKRFLDKLSLKLKPDSQLGDAEIELYYRKAILLEKAIHRELKRHIGEVPVEELKTLPIANFRTLVEQVDASWKIAKGPVDKLASQAFIR